MKAAEKLKAIGDLIKQAFTKMEDETPAPETAPVVDPVIDPAPEAVVDPVQNFEAQAQTLRDEMATMREGFEKRQEAMEKKLERQAEAFKLQHKALEGVLETITAFSESPVKDDENESAEDFEFRRGRKGPSKSAKVEALVARMGKIKNPEPAAAE